MISSNSLGTPDPLFNFSRLNKAMEAVPVLNGALYAQQVVGSICRSLGDHSDDHSEEEFVEIIDNNFMDGNFKRRNVNCV